MAALSRSATGRMVSLRAHTPCSTWIRQAVFFRSGSAPRAAGPERLVGRTATRVCGDTAAKREGWPLKYSCRRRDGRRLCAMATPAMHSQPPPERGPTGHRLEWRRPPARGGSVEARQRPRGPVHGRRTAGHPQPNQQAHADDPGRRGDVERKIMLERHAKAPANTRATRSASTWRGQLRAELGPAAIAREARHRAKQCLSGAGGSVARSTISPERRLPARPGPSAPEPIPCRCPGTHRQPPPRRVRDPARAP